MLKLFQLREGYLAVIILLFITMLISISIIGILSFFKTENHHTVAESFMVEITSNLDEMQRDDVIKSLKSNPYINESSIIYKSAISALDHLNIDLPVQLKSKVVQELDISEIVVFSTDEFEELRVRDEFMNAVKNSFGIRSMRNIGTFKSKNSAKTAQIQILPIGIVLMIIALLFSFALIRSELKSKHAEMKMLSFSGVSDTVILSRLRGSVGFAVLKTWLAAVLLIFGAFHLLSQNILRHISYIGIKDIIVALSVALVMLLIALPMYTNQRAKKILNKF